MSLTKQRRQEMRDNASGCYFCDNTESLEIHHVVPQGAGGTDKESNLQVLCRSCHHKVENMTRRVRENVPSEQRERATDLEDKCNQLSGQIAHLQMRMYKDGYSWEYIKSVRAGDT